MRFDLGVKGGRSTDIVADLIREVKIEVIHG